MNMDEQIQRAILAELQRQSEAGDASLKVEVREAGSIVIDGVINLDELAMAIAGALAGGP